MAAYWFRPKRYGYGATPVTWQGWVVTLAAPAAMVAAWLYLRPAASHDGVALAAMFGFDALVIITLVIIVRRKTDGEWRWRWGGE